MPFPGQNNTAGAVQDQRGTGDLLLVTPNWPNQPWFSELVERLVAPRGQFRYGGTCCLKRWVLCATPCQNYRTCMSDRSERRADIEYATEVLGYDCRSKSPVDQMTLCSEK